MKYIIFDKGYAIIFHEVIVHSDVLVGDFPGKPTSAGFVTLTPKPHYLPNEETNDEHIYAIVHGESISLNLKNNGDEDNRIIEKLIN